MVEDVIIIISKDRPSREGAAIVKQQSHYVYVKTFNCDQCSYGELPEKLKQQNETLSERFKAPNTTGQE